MDDLPRIPSLMRLGDEWLDILEALESCRIRGDPGAANSIVALAIALDADGEAAGVLWVLPGSRFGGARSDCDSMAAISTLFRLAMLPYLS